MTIVGRSKLNHPALGTAGGSALHASIETLYTNIGDDLAGRYETAAAVANSTVTTFDHNFGVQFSDLKVLLYTGSHPNLTRVSDPTASGWVIAATSGFAKLKIDVTTPSSGGPHTFAVFVTQGRGAENLSQLDDVSLGTLGASKLLTYSGSAWAGSYLTHGSETAAISSNTVTPTLGTVVQRITGAASDIQMVAAPVSGKQLILVNETGSTVTVKNDTGGTAANRIYTGSGGDISLNANAALTLVYDSGVSRWVIAGFASAYPDASASVSGIVNITAQTFAGVKTFQDQLRISDGSVTEPGLVFTSDDDATGTGFYRTGANAIGIAINGVLGHLIGATTAHTLGASAGLGTGAAAYHQMYGSLNGVYASGGNRFAIGNDSGLNLNANIYQDGAGTAKALSTVTGYSQLSVLRSTTSGGVVLQLQTNYQDAQTADSAVVTTTSINSLQVTAAGAFTVGPAAEAVNHTLHGSFTSNRSLSGGTALWSFNNVGATVGSTRFEMSAIGTTLSTSVYQRLLRGAAGATTEWDVGMIGNVNGNYEWSASGTTLAGSIVQSTASWIIGNTAKIASSDYIGQKIVGKTDGVAVVAGYIGETLTQSRAASSATSLTTNTTVNVTATKITLTPGDWEISGYVSFQSAATTSVTSFQLGISLTTATLPATDTFGVPTSGEVRVNWDTPAMVNGGGHNTFPIAPYRFSVTANTDIYLVARGTFTVSTLTVYGSFRARRAV